MTLDELIKELQKIQQQGYGKNKVIIAVYSEEFDPNPKIIGNVIVL